MTDPKTRALELVDELCRSVMAIDDRPAELAAALRAAIRAIGGSEWQPLETVPAGTPVRVLLESTRMDPKNGKHSRVIVDYLGQGWDHNDARALASVGAWRPLAWKPADSTELPGEKGPIE